MVARLREVSLEAAALLTGWTLHVLTGSAWRVRTFDDAHEAVDAFDAVTADGPTLARLDAPDGTRVALFTLGSVLLLCALALVGCGGAPFTVGSAFDGDAGDPPLSVAHDGGAVVDLDGSAHPIADAGPEGSTSTSSDTGVEASTDPPSDAGAIDAGAVDASGSGDASSPPPPSEAGAIDAGGNDGCITYTGADSCPALTSGEDGGWEWTTVPASYPEWCFGSLTNVTYNDEPQTFVPGPIELPDNCQGCGQYTCDCLMTYASGEISARCGTHTPVCTGGGSSLIVVTCEGFPDGP
jgi:hypothetical protein